MFRSFGTLYINGQPVKPGTPYPEGAQITFGPTSAGFELQWKPIQGTHSFILAQPALVNISWKQLRDLGFVHGKPFEMDGSVFMVRLPRLGTKPPAGGIPIDVIRFWGQETFIGFQNGKPIQQCPVRGLNSRSWGSAHPSEQALDLAFVPVIDEGI